MAILTNSQVSDIVSLIFEIGRIARERTASGPKFDPASHLQFQTLMFIRDNEPVSMRQIADYLMAAPASVTFLVDRLENHGLIGRLPDNKDRRAVRIKITQRGYKRFEAIHLLFHKKMSDVIQNLNTKRQRQLAKILQELREAYRKQKK